MINSEPLCKIILEGVCVNTRSNVILVQVVSLDLYETGPVLAGTAESAIGGGVRVLCGERKGLWLAEECALRCHN